MPRFDSTVLVYGMSLAVHVAAGWLLSRAEAPAPPKVEIVALQTVVLPKRAPPPEAPPKPPEPPPPAPEAPKAPTRREAPPASDPSPPAPSAAPVADLGFALAGAGGPGGLAVAAVTPTPTTRKEVKALAPSGPAEEGCGEAEVKAKATSMPRPAYTEEATAAAVEGKVRVQLTVDAGGRVTDAKVLEGLGHGLDEAAMDAVRGASFTPATRCGTPVVSTFTVAVRFAL